VDDTNEAITILTQQARFQAELQLGYVVRLDVWRQGIKFSFSRMSVDFPVVEREVPGNTGFAVTQRGAPPSSYGLAGRMNV
jgi:hypothetical protein